MAFWLVVLGSAFLVAMGCGLYLVTRVLKFGVLCRLMSTNRTAAILIAGAKVDLVLSGHTHGGQMLPLAPLVRKLGSNDMVYGYERRDNTDFIVTSGISDWEIKFKTGCKSEFVVVDVNQK